MAKSPPKYALHKPSRQARVRIKGRDVCPGAYNSPESIEEYERRLAQFYLGSIDVPHESLSIARIATMYVDHIVTIGSILRD